MKKFNQKKIKFIKYFEPIFAILFCFIKKRNPKSFKNILLIDLHLIGDIVILLPFIEALVNKYKNSNITLLCGPWANSIINNSLLVNNNIKIINFTAPWIKGYSKKNIYSFLKILFVLKKTKWDIGIDMRGDLRNSFILLLSNVYCKIGYNLMSNGYLLNKIIYKSSKEIHLIDYHKNMAIDLDLISIDDRFIPQLNIINFKNKIGIHFGASMKIRRPSISKIIEFLNVFNHLYNENHILIFKTLEDTNTSDFIYNYLKSLCKNVEYWEGCLGDFIIKLSECKELFCLDSGPGHIAAALQVKVHVIFGPSHPNYSRPIGENVIIYGTINKPKCWPCDGKKCINEVFQKCYSNNLLN